MTTPITPIKDLEPSLVAALKAEVLAGKSIYAVSQAHGINPLTLSRALIKDPDIVKAKAAGVIRQRKGGAPAKKDYTKLPYVIDVIQHGMSTTAAAKKHGISQPVVWNKVKAAREHMEATKAATPTPTPQSTPPLPETLLTATKDLSEAFARAHAAGLSTAAIIKIMSDSLPPTP